MSTADTPVLELDGVTAGYGRTEVLRDITIRVAPGTVVAVLGANGAGKTTTLRAATGLIKPSKGRVRVAGRDMTSAPPHKRAEAGLCLVPEGRGIFRNLTVAENLQMQVPPWARDVDINLAIEKFPVLGRRSRQLAGTMSGGEQQMLALARAYLSRPKIVLLDEVSMGLAPRVVDEIFDFLRGLAAEGLAFLLVEQYVERALEMATNVVLLDRGRVSFFGPPSSLDQDALLANYLGIQTNGAATG